MNPDGKGSSVIFKEEMAEVRRQRREMAERIEYLSKTDDRGRCSFLLYWMADYHPGHPDGENRVAERGQCFRADPRNYGWPRPEEV